MPPSLLGSYASSSTVAWVIYQKYTNGLPLYRQEKDWLQYGFELSRTTMANWVIACTGIYLKVLYEYCHRLLVQRNFAMADETPVQVLKEEGREAAAKSYMWLFRSGEDGMPEIILYHYAPTRSGDTAIEFLKDFHGYLMVDGYTGYNKVKDIRRCCCFAHIRDISSMRSPKGNSVISAFLQCRVSNTATSCLRMSGTLKKKSIRTGRSKTDVSSMKNR